MRSQANNEQGDKVQEEGRMTTAVPPSTTTVVPVPESHSTDIEMILVGTTGESSLVKSEQIILLPSSKQHDAGARSLADSVTTTTRDDDDDDSSSDGLSSRSSSSIESGGSLGKGKTTGDTHSSTTASTAAEKEVGWSMQWTRFVNRSRKPIIQFLQALTTRMAARHPKRTILAISLLSFVLLTVGLATNFNVAVDEATLWTPFGSKPAQHRFWIQQESGFAPVPRSFVLYFHSGGDNVLGKDQVARVFDALDRLRSLEDYNAICNAESSSSSSSDHMGLADDGGEEATSTCEVYGIPRFWNNSVSIFEQEISSDEDAIMAMSSLVFADGIPAARDQVFGLSERDYSTGLLTSTQAYMVTIQFPPNEAAEQFEAVAIDAMLELREAWELEAAGKNYFRLEVMAQRSLSDEYTRAIYADLPLIPLAFIIMTIFTSLVFTQRHKVHSRSLLGLGAVVSVLLSIMSGFGFMFLCGVPFSPVTQLLPFVMFGIGLDDSFVIMGAWLRHHGNTQKDDDDPVERMRKTIDEVGLSITLTSLTSALAFTLGCFSSIPGIFWLCLYAVPTIILIFIYQLTFFVACIILDERRIQQNRRDCCICIVAATSTNTVVATKHDQEHASSFNANSKTVVYSFEAAASKAMGTYANWLLRPWVKVSCLIGFAALAGACAWSTSNMNQEFKFTDVLPQGSYTTAYMDSYATYSSDVRTPLFIYFRNVNQSDANIQQQMQNYVATLGRLDQVQDKPDFFWLVDFLQFTNQASTGSSSLSANSTFSEQLNAFLSIPMYNALYSAHLVRDVHDGSLLSSRCATFLTNFDADNVQSQIDALYSQRAVTKSPPINSNNGQQEEDWAFFNYSNLYDMWEFYSILVDALIATSLLGIAAVTIVALVFIPHWSAAPFVLPIVTVLYIDLLGVIQWAGVHINAVSYITLVMSIGLFVDYILHVLLRYYEATGNRHEKTVEMLQTMGTSILLGGASTLLGTLPLVLSTSVVFHTVFIAFLSFVTLGLAHGLVLLPIILSMIGSEEEIEQPLRGD